MLVDEFPRIQPTTLYTKAWAMDYSPFLFYFMIVNMVKDISLKKMVKDINNVKTSLKKRTFC